MRVICVMMCIRIVLDLNLSHGICCTVLYDTNDVVTRTLRTVTGGWVRDKILGRPASYDIDLALDNMQGKQFADKLNVWYKRKGN